MTAYPATATRTETCDLAVALGRATADGQALFGHNVGRPPGEAQALVREPGRSFAPGEKVRTAHLELPQVRQTFTAVGGRPAGAWGYRHGVNEHGVAVGCGPMRTRLAASGPALLGPELVRLALERSATAVQALGHVTDLIRRYGQSTPDGADHVFLIADAREAYLVEAGGRHWVYQEVRAVRAAPGVCTVGQDWDGIASGLSGRVLEKEWWPDDGSKIDFARAVGSPAAADAALRRWGRATLLLEQQNGHIDAAFLRRLLSDHFEGCADEVDPLDDDPGPAPLCCHAGRHRATATAASLVAELPTEEGRLPLAWYAFGPPCASVYFPVFPAGELPEAFGGGAAGESVWAKALRLQALAAGPEPWAALREALGRLQFRFDQEAEEFAEVGARLQRGGDSAELRRLAAAFHHHLLERFDEVAAGLGGDRARGESVAWDSLGV